MVQAGRDLDVHENVLRKWVKEFGADPVQAFPGHGLMKPEQREIERLRREVAKLKARAGHPKKGRSLPREGIDLKFQLHREAPDDLAGGMAMRRAGGVAVGLPCLAAPLSQRQIPQRRGPLRQGQG
jgi:hypothetical protein